jgi:hypothetical protein
MQKIEKKLQDFNALNHEQKYEIVLEMLKVLEDSNENFKYVYETIQTIKEPSDELLLTIYDEIIELAEKKRELDHQLELQSFEHIKKSIDQIKEKEKQAKEGEDPDSLLKDM